MIAKFPHCTVPRHDNSDCGDDDGDEIEHGVDVISDGAWLVFPLQSLPLKNCKQTAVSKFVNKQMKIKM